MLGTIHLLARLDVAPASSIGECIPQGPSKGAASSTRCRRFNNLSLGGKKALAPWSVALVSLSLSRLQSPSLSIHVVRPILLEPVKLLIARERPCAFITFETTRVVVTTALPAGKKTCLEPRAGNPHPTRAHSSPSSRPASNSPLPFSSFTSTHPPGNAPPALLDTYLCHSVAH